MRQTLDRHSWLLAGSVALPMLAAGIHVNWFGPARLVPRWGGVLSALAAAAVAGALLGRYRRGCLRRKVTATPGKDTTDVPESARSRHKHVAGGLPLTIQYQLRRCVAAEEIRVYTRNPCAQSTGSLRRLPVGLQRLLYGLFASLPARDYTFLLSGCN